MKILIVKTSSLGDIIHTFPALAYLRERFPHGQIDWVVEEPFAEIVRAHPQINRVITISSKKWRRGLFNRECWSQGVQFRKELKKVTYDLLFDFQGNLKSSLIVASARAAKKIGFGRKTVSEWPNLLFTGYRFDPPKEVNVREENLLLAQSFFKDQTPFVYTSVLLKLDTLQQQKLTHFFKNGEKPTLVCPFAAWRNKCLPEEELISFLKQLNRGPYWFIWGSAKEREAAVRLSSFFENSSVLERLSLPLLQHVMARCELVVAMDSLPLHLCGTTATPSLSFFGPSSADKFAPQGKHHATWQGGCPYGEKFERRCSQLRSCPTGACMSLQCGGDRILFKGHEVAEK